MGSTPWENTTHDWAADDGTSGTTMHFLTDSALRDGPVDPAEVARYARAWRQLDVTVEMHHGT